MPNLEKPVASRRSNNEGTYIDRGNGSWAYRRQFRGKLIEKQARADTQAKAKRLAKAKVEDAIKLLEVGVNPSAARITLGAYAQRWLDEDMQPRYDARGNQYAGVAETTFANYARDVRRLQKYIGDVRLGQLGVGQVAGLRRRMELAGETPENQRTAMVRLSTILNLAEARGDVAKNFAAARLVKRPRQAKRQHVQPREDDLTRLMRAVDGDPLEALVWIGLGAGLRRAELLGLRWEDVEYLNPDLAVLVVQRRVNYLGKGINRLERDGLKNGDPFKRVHIGSLMLDVLRMRWVHQLGQRRAALEPGQRRWRGVDYQPDTRTGFIFTNPTDGTPMNPRSADKAFAAIRDRAGLDIERFHALRHAFTTLLRASGTRDRVAMKMTGHRDAAMLDYYDEGLESEQVEAAQRLDERLRMLRH